MRNVLYMFDITYFIYRIQTVNKIEKLALSAVLEDIAQVYMQYFFFEKYMLKD